jgi:hypothetical protein
MTANRRKRHPYAWPGSHTELIRQAETVLRQSRCWYAQLSLLQALCPWELPDSAARHEQRDGAARYEDDRALRGTTAVQTVERWLSLVGTVNAVPVQPVVNGASARRRLRPFVAEAGDLVALALETGRPERSLWIDEKGVADSIGSRAGSPRGYRKHNLCLDRF